VVNLANQFFEAKALVTRLFFIPYAPNDYRKFYISSKDRVEFGIRCERKKKYTFVADHTESIYLSYDFWLI